MAKKAPIRVIVINPKNETITEQTVTPTFQEYYKIMECEIIEAARPPLAGGHFLWVDENGWAKPAHELHTFIMKGYQSSLVGTAIMVRGTAGQAECNLTLDYVKSIVKFT